jgi:hypothetical protein
VWDDGSGAATRERLRRFAALHPQVRLHEGAPARTPAVMQPHLREGSLGTVE